MGRGEGKKRANSRWRLEKPKDINRIVLKNKKTKSHTNFSRKKRKGGVGGWGRGRSVLYADSQAEDLPFN